MGDHTQRLNLSYQFINIKYQFIPIDTWWEVTNVRILSVFGNLKNDAFFRPNFKAEITSPLQN